MLDVIHSVMGGTDVLEVHEQILDDNDGFTEHNDAIAENSHESRRRFERKVAPDWSLLVRDHSVCNKSGVFPIFIL